MLSCFLLPYRVIRPRETVFQAKVSGSAKNIPTCLHFVHLFRVSDLSSDLNCEVHMFLCEGMDLFIQHFLLLFPKAKGDTLEGKRNSAKFPETHVSSLNTIGTFLHYQLNYIFSKSLVPHKNIYNG